MVSHIELLPLCNVSYETNDKGLIYAFVEMRHRDNNNFHLPIGDMILTLDDVLALLHLLYCGGNFVCVWR